MTQELMLLPSAFLVVLTMIAWLQLFIVRIPAMNKAGIDVKEVRSQKMKELLPEHANIASEHFVNLFEVPLLLHLLSILVYITHQGSLGMLYAGSAFVMIRYIHTFIHLTYNNVIHRFTSYILSCLILWAMWVCFIWQLLSNIL